MPRRTDISSICLIGSGPIVIGQACEFDYSGCQALKVLREDGFRTIVVNSNPATIMTDPGFADRTYIEPLDVQGVDRRAPPRAARRAAADARRPDRAQPRDRALRGGHPRRARRRADRRARRRDPAGRGPVAVPRRRRELRPAHAALADRHGGRPARRDPRARGRAAGLHARRPRRRLRRDRGRAARDRRARPAREPDHAGARRGVRARLGRVRARGDPRPQRQRRDRLLDREPRPDGRPHGRLGHRGAADDALRRGLPGAARRLGRDHPRGRRRDRRLQHPVRPQPRDGRDQGDRDEPARLALVRARLEGDGLPDREGRGEARGRLHARRDPERPHEDDAGELRADARLRRRQVPALRVREVPRRRRDARHADEVGRRGDGHRPHVHRGLPQGVRLARARPGLGDAVGDLRRHPRGRPSLVQGAARPRAPRARVARHPARQAGRLGRRLDRRGVGDERRRRAPDALREGHPAVVPPRRLVRRRGRGRLELLLLDLGRGGRGPAAGDEAARRDHRLGPEPDRPGDRVRLLLRPRRADVPRARLRGGDDQLQPGDGLDRLRHLRPPLLRAALARGGARRPRPRAARGRRHPVRRPDAAAARPPHRGCRLRDHGHAALGDRPRRGQGAVRRARRRARHPLPAVGDRRRRRRGARRGRRDRLPGPRAAVVRARRPRDARLLRRRRSCGRR